jgi:hypothetical protein
VKNQGVRDDSFFICRVNGLRPHSPIYCYLCSPTHLLAGRPRFLRLGFRRFGGLLIFISECSFGGILKSAPTKRRAFMMSSDWDVFEAIGYKSPDDPKMKGIIAYYIALGAFMHVWAFWEYAFDLCIAIIYTRSDEGKTIDKKRPVISLERKIRYFRKAHISIEKLEPYRTAGESIANCFEMLGKFRHTVIHSAQGYTDSPLVREFRRMIPAEGEQLLENHAIVNHHQIVEGSKLIIRMIEPTTKYAELLMKAFPKDNG